MCNVIIYLKRIFDYDVNRFRLIEINIYSCMFKFLRIGELYFER